MNTATFDPSFNFAAAGAARTAPGRPTAGRLGFDAADFGAVAFTFAFVAAFVLSGALVGDAYLAAILLQGVDAIDDVAAYGLARDLLPWAAAFTVLTAVVAGAGLRLAAALRRRGPGLGFSRI